MQRFKYSFFLGLVCILSACGSEPSGMEIDTQQTFDSGLELEVLAKGTSQPGEMNDIMELDMSHSFEGKELFSTFSIPDYRARVLLKKPTFLGDYMEGLLKMGVDDSVKMKVSLSLIPEEQLPPELVGKKGNLEIIVRVYNIWNESEVVDEMVNRLSDGHPETWTSTSKGVKVFWDKKGEGQAVEFGDSVVFAVKGLFPSSAVFLTIPKEKPLSLIMGESAIRPLAWEHVLSSCKEGDMITVISPYDMAYGDKDQNPVLKYSTVIFEIDVLKVVKPKQIF